MFKIVKFGLSNKDEKCMNNNLKTSVNTLDKCTYGTMRQESGELALDYLFSKRCEGKRSCQVPIDYTQLFSRECQNILRDR